MARKDIFPKPRPLEHIDKSQADPDKQFLLCFTVPGDYKGEILRELLLLGIHPGALFPEVDRQAESIRWFWRLSEVEKDYKLSVSHRMRPQADAPGRGTRRQAPKGTP
jgi:hypothetical protein